MGFVVCKWSESECARTYARKSAACRKECRQGCGVIAFLFACFAVVLLGCTAAANSGFDESKVMTFATVVTLLLATSVLTVMIYCLSQYAKLETWYSAEKTRLMHQRQRPAVEYCALRDEEARQFETIVGRQPCVTLLGGYDYEDLGDNVQAAVRVRTGRISCDGVNIYIELDGVQMPPKIAECWAMMYGHRIGPNIVVYMEDDWIQFFEIEVL